MTTVNPKSSSPKALPRDGDEKKVLENVIKTSIDNRDRPLDEMRIPAQILYSSYLTESIFRQKYDQTFIEYILSSKNPSKGHNRIIVESVVYSEQVCGLLPRPFEDEQAAFYEYLKKLVPNDKKEGLDAIAKESKKMKAKEIRFLEKIKRYPKAYAVIMGERETIENYGIGQKVYVKFPYKYDIYAGKISSRRAE